MSAIDDSHNLTYVVAQSPVTAFANTGATAVPLCTLGLAGVSITIRPKSGTTNGTFKLQVTDFGSDRLHPPADTDWVDYPNSTQPAVAAAITAAINWEVANPASAFMRVVFTNNGSASPVVDAAVTHRALP